MPRQRPTMRRRSARGVLVARGTLYFFLALSAVALAASGLLWQKLSNIQEQLARQSADSGRQRRSRRARVARQAQELARETAARQALTETRLGEVALQRTQLEELMQSLSRSRDENLVVDIESALRLAQQQAQLTGSVEPLLAELRSADKRLERAGAAAAVARARRHRARHRPHPRGQRDRRAGPAGEAGRAGAPGGRTAAGQRRGTRAAAAGAAARKAASASVQLQWWEQLLGRCARGGAGPGAGQPGGRAGSGAAGARAGVLPARKPQAQAAQRAAGAAGAPDRIGARPTWPRPGRPCASISTRRRAGPRRAVALLQQVQGQLRAVELPRIDETLAALATAAAGR